MHEKWPDKVAVWVWLLIILGFGLLIFIYSRPIVSPKDYEAAEEFSRPVAIHN